MSKVTIQLHRFLIGDTILVVGGYSPDAVNQAGIDAIAPNVAACMANLGAGGDVSRSVIDLELEMPEPAGLHGINAGGDCPDAPDEPPIEPVRLASLPDGMVALALADASASHVDGAAA